MIAPELPSTSSALRLARDLKSRNKQELIELLGARSFSAPTVRDFFDLADALLADSSIMDALALVPRTTLVRLASAELVPQDGLLVRLGLAIALPDGTLEPMDEVTQAARALCESKQISATDQPPPDSTKTGSATSNDISEQPILEQAGIERGLTLATALDELLTNISSRPARRMNTGTLAATDATRLSLTIEHTGLPIMSAIELTQHSGLLALVDGWWMPSPDMETWRAGAPAQRWVDLAFGWRSALDSRVVEILFARSGWGESLDAYIRWLFPVGAQWIIDLTVRAIADAEHLGLCIGGARQPITAAILENDSPASRELVLARATKALPDPVEVVYVQNDLTIVAPGMLRPEAEQLLRRICDVEHSGLASTFRLNATRITTAIANGMTSGEIIEQLQGLSATPLPQPVVYLIEDTGARFGGVRVRPWGTGALVTARDEALLDLLIADSALASLAWARVSETTASTRQDPMTTQELLVSQKHPAVLEDDDGRLVVTRPAMALPIASRAPAVPVLHAFVDRLIASTATDTGSISNLDDAVAWRERQISVAIREKSSLEVTFDMPDGSSKSLTIIPLSLANGRLRAKDMVTEVERTLPMASISGLVTPVA